MIRPRKSRNAFRVFLSRVFFAALIAIAGFLSYKVYIVSYEKYQINKQISNLDAQLRALAQKSEGLKLLVARLHNKDVIEKEARKKLNLVKEGEKTVIITDKNKRQKTAAPLTVKIASSSDWLVNPRKWFEVLFPEQQYSKEK